MGIQNAVVVVARQFARSAFVGFLLFVDFGGGSGGCGCTAVVPAWHVVSAVGVLCVVLV